MLSLEVIVLLKHLVLNVSKDNEVYLQIAS